MSRCVRKRRGDDERLRPIAYRYRTRCPDEGCDLLDDVRHNGAQVVGATAAGMTFRGEGKAAAIDMRAEHAKGLSASLS
jgi:hypothetical protein